MSISPVFLKTDILIWLLVAAVVGYALHARRHPHLLVPWVKVRRNGIAMACATVLAAYAVVGLLDSLHFRMSIPNAKPAQPAAGRSQPAASGQFSVDVKSVLDLLIDAGFGPMAGKSEKTYSAPLATHSFARETVERPDGTQVREFPRLTAGGAHLKDPSQAGGDIAWRTLAGLTAGFLLWALLCVVLCLLIGRGRALLRTWHAVWHDDGDAPWRPVLLTLLVICLLLAVAVSLGSRYHLFGTDKVGQDVLTLSLKSIRTGLLIGTLTTMVMLPFAVLAGLAAGYFKGWVDDLIVYVYTTLSSIPGVLLIAAAVLMTQVYIDTHPESFQTTLERADFRLLALCVILGVTSWTGLCRLLRGEALKLRELDYIQAAQAFGVAKLRILSRHMLPNVMHLVTISAVMDFSGMVLAEAVLSYVGVGVDPTMNSFGTMINAARFEISREPVVWWLLAAAFFFMLALVLAANLFADAVQEAFDPRRVMRRPRPRLMEAKRA
jgi:peptide/nickel transport system permease protein